MKLFLALSSLLLLCNLIQARTFNRARYDSFADGYSSMGDLDWTKRAGRDNGISPAYGYSSMADTDWGWKKRSMEDDSDDDVIAVDDETDVDKRSKYSNNYYLPYKYRQPHSLASTSYRGYAEPQSSIAAAAAAAEHAISQRSRGGDRQYGYVSMADLDWGWKKKRADSADLSKRNLASLARGNELPYRFRSRRISPSQADEVDPFTYLAHQYELINEQQAIDDELQRQTRSGVGALARNGGVRPAVKEPGRR
jgi:hypothetical protein